MNEGIPELLRQQESVAVVLADVAATLRALAGDQPGESRILSAGFPREGIQSGRSDDRQEGSPVDSMAGLVEIAQLDAQKALDRTTTALLDLLSGITGNTDAVRSNTSAFARAIDGLVSGLTGRSSGGSGLGGLFGGALGLARIGLGIGGLFGGGRNRDEPEFTEAVLPPSINIEALSRSVLGVVSGGGEVVQARATDSIGAAESPAIVQSRFPAGQITVNINAMDSRSFLDRSSDIAEAVRDAMLHMHPVNDFISEL